MRYVLPLLIAVLSNVAHADTFNSVRGDTVSVGFAGIDATGLRDPDGSILTGSGVTRDSQLTQSPQLQSDRIANVKIPRKYLTSILF